MTIEMNDPIGDVESDIEIAETINFMLTQPVETLEMLQQRFLTNPNICGLNYTANKADIKVNQRDNVSIIPQSKVFHASSEDIVEIPLENNQIIRSSMTLSNNPQSLRLPKVDNFIDSDVADGIDFLQLNSSESQELKIEDSTEEDGANNEVKQSTYLDGDLNGKIEVCILPSMTEDAVLPGQPNEESFDNPDSSQQPTDEEKRVMISTYLENSYDNHNGDDIEECSDRVVEFELDESYDYDSVTFTPKCHLHKNGSHW